jgi:bacillithiol synthase
MLRTEKIPFSEINSLSFKDKFYQQNPGQLKDFIQFTPDMNGLEDAIKARKNHFPVDRELLVEVLQDHYSKIETSEIQSKNIIELLDNNTFTVVTAHQPSLLGGPAYYFYKIYSTINLCRQLSEKFRDCKFVPVFISGSEDHDFDEVKSLYLYNNTIEWENESKGPVGRFDLKGLQEVINNAQEILGHNDHVTEIISIFNTSLAHASTYNDFVFLWLNKIFGAYGVIVLNMDDSRFKKAFAPFIRKEIVERSSIDIVQKTQDELANKGFRPQAFARDINFFYMLDGLRERIFFENDLYHVNHTDLVFSESEILELISNYPERFSPNVIMRPLYQEFSLPNIAYIGGGGEIAYWLERKSQFDYFGIFFPVLIRRNSLMLITKAVQKTMDKPGITLHLLLKEESQMITEYLEYAAAADFHLAHEMEKINQVFEEISDRAKIIDPTLGPFVLGEGHKVIKSIEAIEARLKKTIKHKEETAINQLKNIRKKLFPENNLQERKDSFLQYLSVEGLKFQDEMIALCDPLEKDFLFLYL